MKNRNILLVSAFILILAFFLWISWKNEKRDYTPINETPDTITIKQPVVDYKVYDNDNKGK